jgi:phosphoribosylglycinamide formyltransferase-1
MGVLVSGRGSNLGAILDAAREGRLDAEVVLVVSDRPDASALRRAEERGVESRVAERKDFPDAESFENAIAGLLEERGVELVVLAGFMRVLGPAFVRRFAGRIVNIHPSLLPSFPGLHAQRQALRHGVKIAGCTVHLVDETLDGGPILAQAAVPVLEGDTEESLSERILKEEHKLLPETIQKFFCKGIPKGRGLGALPHMH